MSDTSCGDPPDDPAPEESLDARAPRTNLLLAATIEAGGLRAAVRIRNLSESGALLEGGAFPDVGEKLTLRRMNLEVDAVVVRRTAARCGVKFAGRIVIAEWASGTIGTRASTRAPARAAVRSGSPAAAPLIRAENMRSSLDRRIGEELRHVCRLLEEINGKFSGEPMITRRHPETLQKFDRACQTLGHLAAILEAEDREAAVAGLEADDLRTRLSRRILFKKR